MTTQPSIFDVPCWTLIRSLIVVSLRSAANLLVAGVDVGYTTHAYDPGTTVPTPSVAIVTSIVADGGRPYSEKIDALSV